MTHGKHVLRGRIVWSTGSEEVLISPGGKCEAAYQPDNPVLDVDPAG